MGTPVADPESESVEIADIHPLRESDKRRGPRNISKTLVRIISV